MIRLESISGDNFRDLLKLHVGKGQESFVAPNDISIIEAYLAVTHNGHAFPFGIYDGETPVGFCMIGYDADDDWKDAPAVARGNYNLWRLMIDEKYQGRGYGREAMQAILDFVASEPCGGAEMCWLSYEPENTAAQKLYASFGFRETGDRDGNEIIAVLPMESVRAMKTGALREDPAAESQVRERRIYGGNRFETLTKTRVGSRAVILEGDRILLSHELKSGWWLTPGGGMEDGETPEMCVARETEEETGRIVRPLRKFLVLYEYYEGVCYISHYYLCSVIGEGQMHLTDDEQQCGAQPEWIALKDAFEMFSGHQEYAQESEEKQRSYYREFVALSEYMAQKEEEAEKTGR